MGDDFHPFTTASVDALPFANVGPDPTPGLVLVYAKGHERLPAALPFGTSPTTIGRDPSCSLALPEAAASRIHARAIKRPDGWWLADAESTNGTHVNGARIDEHKLADQDVVRIGDSLFRFASAGIYAHCAYRIDGTIIKQVRPVNHGIDDSKVVGGCLMDQVLDVVSKVAPAGLAVVITGESGTGKELVAREVHRQSKRNGPFVAINCAALPTNLIESELFGYRKGAFTGASHDQQGLVRSADGGTLLLDEVGDMPLEAQAKMLRVLQEKEVVPLGSSTAHKVDIQVLSATHRDLDVAVAEGAFRGDLLARLREAQCHLPPLRDRREDLLPLLRHFLRVANRPDAEVGLSYMIGLAHYGWPYNVRELASAVKLSVAMAGTAKLELTHLPEAILATAPGHPKEGSKKPLLPAPRSATPTAPELRALLTEHRGNIAAVGRALGKERMQIHRWLKRYGIDPDSFRG